MFPYIRELGSQKLLDAIVRYSDGNIENINWDEFSEWLLFYEKDLSSEFAKHARTLYNHFESINREKVQLCEGMSNTEYLMFIGEL